MSIKEALIGVFSDDPINWLKWGIVFAILIGGYIIAIPLYGKVSSRLSWERKRDIARSRDRTNIEDYLKSFADFGFINLELVERQSGRRQPNKPSQRVTASV